MRTQKHKCDNRMLAGLIADCLFENGKKQYAERLVLVGKSGNDIGGWCKGAALDRIEEKLNQWNPNES